VCTAAKGSYPGLIAGATREFLSGHFRHSYATILKSHGEDVKTVQELLRHANSSVTMNLYAPALTDIKRSAHNKVARLVVNQEKVIQSEWCLIGRYKTSFNIAVKETASSRSIETLLIIRMHRSESFKFSAKSARNKESKWRPTPLNWTSGTQIGSAKQKIGGAYAFRVYNYALCVRSQS
jgi:Phage integrase family